ncbi:hypothetical protein LCGC14_1291400 [marine sediment metagenome]|uniref:Rad50/SbcC-type AAA domain-containing protein n=1 Tax=marine sediment metagenome TaxID=412755 RepID=A0A0F9LD60_9ZZZZ
MSETIKLENAGPVESLTVPILDEGGITVIKGMNDCGKSLSLEAFQALLGGSQKIRKRFGSPQGVVEGLGATIRLMANARASGECEAVSLTGKLDIGDLIDPGLKNPVAADKERIKTLLTVRGVKADIGLFCPMAGISQDEMKQFASDATLASTHLVDMAARLKTDFEAASRKAGDNAKTAEADARAKRESAEGIDLEAESDGEKLQDRLEVAIRDETTVIQTRDNSVAAFDKVAKARTKLAEAKTNYDGPTLEEAKKRVDEVGDHLDSARVEVAARRKALEAAEEEESRLDTLFRMAIDKRTATAQHEDAMAGWSETIADAANVEEVSNADIQAAVQAVRDARDAAENGVRIRDAKKALAEADDLQSDANLHQNVAEQLRDAAKGTIDVLAKAVKAGALIPVTDDNGKFRFAVKPENGEDRRTYYHNLGPGLRTSIAIREVAACLRDLDPEVIKHAVVVLPQSPWEGLDWLERLRVYKEVKQLGVNVVTGECDKDPANTGGIRAEVFVPNEPEVTA